MYVSALTKEHVAEEMKEFCKDVITSTEAKCTKTYIRAICVDDESCRVITFTSSAMFEVKYFNAVSHNDHIGNYNLQEHLHCLCFAFA